MYVGHDRKTFPLAELRQRYVTRVLEHDVAFVEAARAEIVVVGGSLNPAAPARREQKCSALATVRAAPLEVADQAKPEVAPKT